MHQRPGPGIALATFVATLALGTAPALADNFPLPIIDIVPRTTWSIESDGIAPGGGPYVPISPTNGETELTGTITQPLYKTLSVSYSRLAPGSFDSHLAPFIAGGKTIYPGGVRDVLQEYRVDYGIGRFTIEGGFAERYRENPAASFDWHKGYLGLTYATPGIKFLNNSFFVLNLTANDSKHFSSPDALASFSPGLALPNGSHILTTEQSVTFVAPVVPKQGISLAAVFLWGALDYPTNAPFPLYYDNVIVAATKQFTPWFSTTLNAQHVAQRTGQGYPFPTGYGIRTTALELDAAFHVDFNKIVYRAAPAPKPTTAPVQAPPVQPSGVGGASPANPVPPAPTPTPSPAA